MPTPRPIGQEDYTWDQRLNNGLGGYRSNTTGQVVSQNEVDTALLRRIDKSVAEIERISVQLARKEISLSDWQRSMRDNMKIVYTYSGSLAGGGWANMSRNDWLGTARASRFNYRFLQNFALEIQNGSYPITLANGQVNGRFIQRARQYGQAGRAVYYQMQKIRAEQAGGRFIASIRHAQDSCPGCIAQENLGIVPINDSRLIPIGSRDCLRKCLCRWQFFTPAQATAAGVTLPTQTLGI